MITRQDKQRVLEALDERLCMELLLNPVDALCDTWDYGHCRTFRRLVWASDWPGLARALDACPETAVVESMRTLIKEASPRLYAMVTPRFVIPEHAGGRPVGVWEIDVDARVVTPCRRTDAPTASGQTLLLRGLATGL